MMVSSVEARKMLSKGCMGYLTHTVSKVDESVPNFQNTLIVCEF